MPCANCRQDLVSSANSVSTSFTAETQRKELEEHDNPGSNDVICTIPDDKNENTAAGHCQNSSVLVTSEHGEVKRSTFSVRDALLTVFEGFLKRKRRSFDSNESNLKLCPDCLKILHILYDSYRDFMHLTKEGSYIQHTIGNTCLWNFEEVEYNSSLGDDHPDCSDLVKVELHEDGNTSGSHLQIKKETVESDPDYEPSQFHMIDDEDEKFPFLRSIRRTSGSQHVMRLRKSRARMKRTSSSSSSSKRSASVLKSTVMRKIRRKPITSARIVKILPISASNDSENKKVKVPKLKSTDTDTNSNLLKCTEPNCTKAYADPKLLRRHIKYSHGGATAEELEARRCTHCSEPKIFMTPGQLRVHISTVHATEYSFSCTKCEQKFPTRNRLQVHLRLKHSKVKPIRLPKEPYNCPHSCTKDTFPSKVSLRLHLKSVHGETQEFVCTQCGIKCERPNQLANHFKYRHGVGLTAEDLEGHQCPTCSKTFDKRFQLKYHMKAVHSAEKPFVCEVAECGRRFPTKNYLQIHCHRMHKGRDQKFPCEECDKEFVTKRSYEQHVEGVHLRRRDYICEVCGKKFRVPSEVRKHMETHNESRERPWECDFCHQFFLTQKILLVHKKTHSGVKDQLCTYCGETFLQVGSLRRHLQAIHGVVPSHGVDSKGPHECEQCGKKFKLKEYLRQHLRSKTHGGKGHTAQKRNSTGESDNPIAAASNRKSRSQRSPTSVAKALRTSAPRTTAANVAPSTVLQQNTSQESMNLTYLYGYQHPTPGTMVSRSLLSYYR